ncbi:unnamed protein product, partial [Staurois parvus]
MRGSGSAQRGDRRCAVSLGHSGSQKEPKISAQSYDQLCPITADHIGDMYTDHLGTDDQCALMITVAPEVHLSVLISATCQCPSVPHISAYQCTSMPHISAHLSCLSMSPITASQCHLSM